MNINYIHRPPSPSTLHWHLHTRPRGHRILTPPQTRNRLRLRIKINSGFPIKRTNSTPRHTLLVPRKTEHGQGDGNGYVYAHLSGFDFFLEASRGGAAAGKDGDAVAVFVGVDEGDGIVHGGDVDADENGAEDFFGVAAHVGADVGDDCRSELREGGQYAIGFVFGKLGGITQLPLGYFSGL